MDEISAKPSAIIPKGVASLRTMTVTMTVMCYLACLAIGALILINRAVDDWTHGISREVTVQLRQISNVDTEAELKKATALLQTTIGVVSVEALDRKASLKLLEPWLGNTNLDELPVPRLIRVTIDEASPPDFDTLEKNLSANIKGASLDTHRRWEAELARMAHSLTLLSWWILALICGSAVAMVVFAARAALDANREVVEVLRLVGAKNSFIARQISQRFLITGLVPGCAGIILAGITFLGLGSTGEAAGNGVAAASFTLLFAPHGDLLSTLLIVLAVPLVATLIALVTANMTLTHMLRAAP
jgi:cell division transport system permease protein